MAKQWTLEEDLFIAEYEGVDANFIAAHDLNKKTPGAGAKRIKALKEAGVWPKIMDYIKAREIMRCHHILAFNRSPIVREHAALDLRELGEELSDEAREIVENYDARNAEATEKLKEWDRQTQERLGLKPW